MSDAARVVDRPEAAALLALVDGARHTGFDLAATSGLASADFQRLAVRLWMARLLQGDVADGCCRDPCGVTCVCALRMDRTWHLSRKGASTLRCHGAKGYPPKDHR